MLFIILVEVEQNKLRSWNLSKIKIILQMGREPQGLLQLENERKASNIKGNGKK
jgi:hypothetical protein